MIRGYKESLPMKAESTPGIYRRDLSTEEVEQSHLQIMNAIHKVVNEFLDKIQKERVMDT
jgi:hypothetical protein